MRVIIIGLGIQGEKRRKILDKNDTEFSNSYWKKNSTPSLFGVFLANDQSFSFRPVFLQKLSDIQ